MISVNKIRILVASLLVGGVIVGWLAWTKEPSSAILTTNVIRGDISQTVLASGILEAIDLVNIGAQVSGQVTHIFVEVGDQVKKGDLLAEIDPLIAKNNLKIAQAELASNHAQFKIKQAQLKQSKLTWNRQLQMFQQEACSRADLESAEVQMEIAHAELQNSQASIDAARIKVERAKTELSYTKIIAPMDGTVISIATRQGQTLATSQTVPTLLKLANLDTMNVKAQISEADVSKVKIGMPVYFTLIGDSDTRYNGTLRAIELAPTNINEQQSTIVTTGNNAVYYNALFNVPNQEHALRVAMTAQVVIVLDERKQVLILPQAALSKQLADNTYEVTLIDGEVRRIKTGLKDDFRIEVISGLSESDEIKLNHGTPIFNKNKGLLL
ncbi:efflux RND transporter periplasmic adaptor subunit [Aeromonas veronii]